MAHNNFHVIGITENWRNGSIGDGELYLKGCNLFHVDKRSGIGGGILLYLHDSLPATEHCALL